VTNFSVLFIFSIYMLRLACRRKSI